MKTTITMKTTMKTMTTTFTLLLLLALLPAALRAQEGQLRRTGDVSTNTTFQDFEGVFEQTISLKFGTKPVVLTLPVGATAAVTLGEMATFIGLLGDEFDLSSFIGLLDDEIALSSHAGIRKLDDKRFAIRGIGAGEVSLLFKDKKGREAILKINVTEPEPVPEPEPELEPEEQQDIEKE
jgi:hypothetical protein